ncbi:valine--tRNA ligase-like [Lineus longissimus]|uniref:valine--tRNA ligase-like n=1 Tax=Lineus longissimus TaxID=88925 RepID=UPI00315DF5E7
MVVNWCRARQIYNKCGIKLFKKTLLSNKSCNYGKDSDLGVRLTEVYRIPSQTFATCTPQRLKFDSCFGRPLEGADTGEKAREKSKLKKRVKEAKTLLNVEKILKQGENQADLKKNVPSTYNIDTKPGQKKDTSIPLPKAYNPEFVEASWYSWWEGSGFFTPEYSIKENEKKKYFVMCLPPPNVTGSLHLGHAITNSIQDAIIRWRRMRGDVTLWNPGCDHAGIATQVVVEKKLWKEQQRTRYDVGRERFVDEIWKWKNEKGDQIYEQMRQMGSSLDWTRARFTMDPKLSRAVTEAFVHLHDEGLIYRGNRLVNWSCQLKSVISDIEVDEKEILGRTMLQVPGHKKKVEFGTLKSFAYKVVGSGEEIVVATTRLETMLGDTAVAVHPDDHRYSNLHGKMLTHPFCDRQIPVICDEFVDREFGTGAVKITPGHSHTDFEVGTRHQLPLLSIMDDNGRINDVFPKFEGLDRFECRRKIEETLKQLDLFRGTADHKMTVPICSRSGDVIEPRLKEQWYINCQEMAAQAVDVVRNGDLEILPGNHENIWYNWMEKSRDWCISRQLWWGHRIPAYKVVSLQDDQNRADVWVSGRSEEEARKRACEKLCVGPEQFRLVQDEDVLDTWFSSALFPFSIFGWPEKTKELDSFYPTSILETGSDILFFWVARMVMLGQKLTGQLPFKKVLLHGLLRDSHGRKMSKSLGNVIDPLDVIRGISLQDLQKQLGSSNLDQREIEKAKLGQKSDFPLGIPQCGTDALRFALCSYNFKAQFINMNITHVKSYRNFCNKIWQAFRFYLINTVEFQPSSKFEVSSATRATDQWILSRLSHLIEMCGVHFQSYDLHLVTKALYQFWYQELCDVYLECIKPVLKSGNVSDKQSVLETLHVCIDVALRAMSPFMPYLTEELYQRLRGGIEVASVCLAKYPDSSEICYRNTAVEDEMEVLSKIVTAALSVRSLFNLKSKPNVYLVCDNKVRDVVETFREELNTLSRSQSVTVTSSPPQGCVKVDILEGSQLYMEVKGLIDPLQQFHLAEAKETKLMAELDNLTEKINTTTKEHLEIVYREKRHEVQKSLDKILELKEMLRYLM